MARKKGRQRCFVIMPFSQTTPEHTEDYWTQHYEHFLRPLIEQIPDCKACRSEAFRGDIPSQIITDLINSPIVIADLTDHNPNVFWELGIRQSFKHGTVTIAQEGTRLPFDISSKGTLPYPGSHLGFEEFASVFKAAIQDCVDNPERPDSRVLETISGRGTLFEILHRDETIRRLDAVLYECKKNSTTLKSIIGYCEKNKERGGEMVTHHLGSSAIELLITNRYVNENEEFYVEADNYKLFLVAINEAIDRWHLRVPGADKLRGTNWLWRTAEQTNTRLSEIKEKVEAARVKLGAVL